MYGCAGCALHNYGWCLLKLCNATQWSYWEVMDSTPCCFLSMGGLDARLQGSQDKALHTITSKAFLLESGECLGIRKGLFSDGVQLCSNGGSEDRCSSPLRLWLHRAAC